MQTIEAVFSLTLFLSIASAALSGAAPRPLDDSLYRIQLAEDAWRVLYLRNDFESLGRPPSEKLETDLRALGTMTGKCYFISGIEMTNCRGSPITEFRSKSRRTIIYDGQPKQVTFSIGR